MQFPIVHISSKKKKHASAKMSNPKVFMDVAIGGKPAGKMVFELFRSKLPLTSQNFLSLCRGMPSPHPQFKGQLAYKNSLFHRIIPGFMAQGGDFTHGDGRGGLSIYAPGRFNDEGFVRQLGHGHNGRGILSMANAGPNTNGSQFFICFNECNWLDNRHVVFGKLVEGAKILDDIEAVGSESGRPRKEVKIVDCGEVGGSDASADKKEE